MVRLTRKNLVLLIVLPLLMFVVVQMSLKLKSWRYWELAPHYVADSFMRVVRPDVEPTLTGSYLAGYVAQQRNEIMQAAEFYDQALHASQDAENPIVFQSTYKAMLLSGDVERALKLAERFLKQDKESVSAMLIVTTDLMKQQNFPQAKKLLTENLKIDSELLRLASIDMLIMPYLSAWAYVGNGEIEQAIGLIDENFGKYKVFYLFSQYQKALMYEVAGKNERAYQSYRNAIGKLTLPYHLVLHAGNLMERLGKRDEAKTLYEQYQLAQPHSNVFSSALARIEAKETPQPEIKSLTHGVVEVMLEAARVLMRGNYAVEALAYAQLAHYLEPSHPEANVILAGAFEQLQSHQAAIDGYENIAEDSPLYLKANIAIAKNYFLIGEKEKAFDRLEDLKSKYEDDILTILTLADLYRQDERFERAAAFYEQTIQKIEEAGEPVWSVYFAAGIANERAKNWDVAETYLKKALELEPQRPEILNYLGYSWIDRGMHVQKGKEMIAEALEYAMQDAHILDSMGWAHFKLGEYEEAVTYLEMAVEKRPYDPILNDHLGDVYWKLGRKNEARFQWQRALNYREDSQDISTEVLKSKLTEGLTE